jgi:hypothetical protein
MSALGTYESSGGREVLSLVEVHCLLSQAEEDNNELVSALRHIEYSILLLRRIHKIDRQYLNLLDRFETLLMAILNHRNANYLKSAYFIVSNLFDLHLPASLNS